MKIHVTEDRDIITDGTLETAQFRIKASAKAFKILIDRLYSDKIKAVCRELMTNALDAHVANGNPEQPFEITVPNPYDSFFAVRDFGISMTHEQIMGLYSTVFESTKDNDNTAVGQLGLGSKSPFAYSDTFTVTAWKDGEKRVYTAYIGTDSIPRIDLLLREPSDEPQGVEVRVPTRDEDEKTFLARVKDLAYGFDVLPTVRGIHGFSIKPLTPTFEGTGWRMYSTHAPIAARLQARQGCVLYPISSGAINLYQLAKGVGDLMSVPLVVDFPIGQIDFTPSREEISYDAQTQENIKTRMAEVAAEFLDLYKQKLAACPTEVEARKFAVGVINSFGWNQSDLKDLLRAVKWRNRRVGAAQVELVLPQRDAGALHFKIYRKEWFIPNRRNKDKLYTGTSGNVDPSTTAVIWYTPDENLKRISERLMTFARSSDWSGFSSVVLVSCLSPTSRAVKRFLINCCRTTSIFKLSDYMPDKSVRGQTTRVKVSAKIVNADNKMEPVQIDATLGGFYIRSEHAYLPGNIKPVDVRALRNNARKLGLIPQDAELYVIPSSILARTIKHGPWTDFMTFAKAAVQDDTDLVLDIQRRNSRRNMVEQGPDHARHLYMYSIKNPKLAARLASTGLGQLLADFKSVEPDDKVAAEWRTLCGLRADLRMTMLGDADMRAERKLLWSHKDTLDAYPLLKAIAATQGFNHVSEDDIVAYVRQIDSASSSVTLSAIAA